MTLGVLEIVAGLLTAHHTWELFPTMLLMLVLSAKSALIAVGAYMVYMALEPDVRRRWPQTLVSWSRVIAGRLSDPLVGRDLLVGTALGVLIQIVSQFEHLAPLWLGQPPTLATPPGGFDGTVPFDLATVLVQVVRSVLFASVLVLVYVMLFALIRRRAVTNVVFVLLQALFVASDAGFGISLVFSMLVVGVGLFTLARYGMLALIVAIDGCRYARADSADLQCQLDVRAVVVRPAGRDRRGRRVWLPHEPCRAAVAQWKVPRLISSAPA